MFSGIVEEKGKVSKVVRKKNLIVLSIETKNVYRGIKIGDSVSVDGICLTVTKRNKRVLTFDVMLETIQKTTLKYAKPKTEVNLERSLKVNDRIGGHFVSGHIDGVGEITKKITLENYVEYWIKTQKNMAKYVVPKGSICIDGISLTVGRVKGADFSVYIIPHTLDVTTLRSKKVGSKVNIETDLLAKYILAQGILKK